MAQCGRCGGLVVLEGRLADAPVRSPADIEAVLALADEGRCWRCVNCGDRTDPVIEANRRALVPPAIWQGWRRPAGKTAGQAVPEARCTASLPACDGLSEAVEL